jgi:hypothetical protein
MRWPDLRYDQTDLPRLCRARDFYATEYHPQNHLYGLDRLLREYAGLPPGEPLPWAMEHAISFDAPQPQPADAASALPILLAVTEAQAEILRRHVAGRVLAIGSAFFYARHLYHLRHPQEAAEVPAAERRGTLVLPDKLNVRKDLDFDRERFADELAALPAEFQPVAVSIFWKDFERGTHLPFERAGLRLVTSGHFYDPLFHLRQYDLCRQFKYACANNLSASFCVSVLAGCRFFYLPTGPLSVTSDGVRRQFDREPTLTLPGKQECINASPSPPAGDGARQRELAARYAGRAFVRPPEFFRELFDEGRRLLQAEPPPPAEFRPGGRLDRQTGWLPRGIEHDGWARAECGLVIPPRPGFEGVQLNLHVPRDAAPDGQTVWTVTFDGGEPQPLPVRPGFWRLELPAGRDGRPRRVAINCGGPPQPDGEPRRRAFRLFQITWREKSSGRVVWQKQPFVRWAKDIRGRGDWVKGSLRRWAGATPLGDFYRYLQARRPGG